MHMYLLLCHWRAAVCVVGADVLNLRVHRIRSTTSVEAFSDNEAEHERDTVETNRMSSAFGTMNTPAGASSPSHSQTVVSDWGMDEDSSVFGATPSPAASDASSAGPAVAPSLGGSGHAAAGRTASLQASAAAAARRRMSAAGCRPVSETTARPHSPLHRCSSNKGQGDRAGKATPTMMRKIPSLSRSGSKTGSSLRLNSPTRHNAVAMAANLMADRCGIVDPSRLSPMSQRATFNRPDEPPVFRGFGADG